MNTYSRIILIISVIIEYLIAVYYTNTSLTYKNNRVTSNLLICIGYITIGIISMFNIPYINLLSFIIINYIILRMAFVETKNGSLIKVIIITAFMMFGEIVLSLCINQILNYDFSNITTIWNDILFSAGSKLIYFICVIIFKNFTVYRGDAEHTKELFLLFPLPITSCICFILINIASISIEPNLKMRLIIMGVLLIISNYIIYVVYDRIIDQNIKIRYLQKIKAKKEIDYASYELIKNKYDDLKILVHDFNKYCNNIEGMLSEEQVEALNQIKHIQNLSRELLLIEYTNNKALNILLSQKMSECNKKNINFNIYTQAIDLSFINEVDCVSIFTNLIDNAIEACDKSGIKNIYLHIYSINESFTAVKIENNTDETPISFKETLKTTKINAANHGIGYASIKRALINYNAGIRWRYNDKYKLFTAVILFNRFTEIVKNQPIL